MSTNGILDFQNTNKVIFRGTDSNVVVDTSNASIGIGIQGTEKPGSNLHVIGDASISSNLKLTTDTSITVNSNVVTDFNGPHAREPKEVPLKKYPEIVFESGKFEANESTDTYVQAGYKVIVSGFVNSSNHPWKAFNGIDSEVGMLLSGLNYDTSGNANTSGTTASRLSASDSTPYGEWLKLELPNKIKLDKYVFTSRNHATHWAQGPEAGQVWGSNDDSNWEHVHTFTNSGFTGASQYASFDVQTDNYYKYYAFIVTKTFAAGSDYYLCVPELKYYGYEEDPPAGDSSIDTTFTSIMNTPQTTGANVYVDAKLSSGFTNQVTGPTPVGTNTTHDNTNKYWELTGELTSNITVEANTFLEGDQPHAVSMWFNSSNLEANVSNTCVFSIASEEKLDSVNLDLQSNTWHNLTYAYQGEGGYRVTYLDGRKVAEDQAEDTFGDYPPFAMTGYSQGGYVVSASSRYTGNSYWYPYEAFNGSVGGTIGHLSEGNHYTTADPGTYNGTDTNAFLGTRVDTGADIVEGDWLKIEMPHKLVADYLQIYSTSDEPDSFKLYGSNDDLVWTELLSVTGNTTIQTYLNYPTTTKGAFKYFALVVSKQGSTQTYWRLDEMKIYGHRENDLVRLPDPTNVLNYPHVSIPSSYTKRGYVVSASNDQYMYGSRPPPLIEARGAWAAFGDNGSEPGWQLYYPTGQEPYSTSPDGNGFYQTNNLAPTLAGTSHRGHWIKLELPHKLMVQKMKTDHGTQPERLGQVILLGSNNDSDWYTIKDTFALTNASAQTTDINATVAYKYIVLIVKSLQSSSINVDLKNLEYYGTGVDSIPIQIGGGNIDKVANFRVYDKFVGEDQALEIWDAQKDEFGRAKSSMTLHKGRLGIGTTEPEGRLAVLDEPHNLEEFPPRALSAEKTYIEGHGEFYVSTTNVYDSNYTGYKAFNKNLTASAGNWWSEADPGSYDNGTGAYTGTSDYFTNVEGHIALGHWIQIEFPYKINYRYSEIQGPNHAIGRQPHTGYILGSNDLEGVWTSLHRFANVTRTHKYESVTYTPPTVSTQTFKYFRLVIEKMGGGNTHAGISQWDIFGTREQGQSVLHDGQLTLTKNLTVPRIGPALDVDDTPRRDRLVVEYNTSTNPAFEVAVRDTSGRGLDGTLVGSSYNATKKALVFDGVDDIIEADLGSQIFKNSSLHTTSLWVKLHKHTTSSMQQFFSLGNGLGNPNGNLKHIQLFHSDNHGLRLSFTHHDYRVGFVLPIGKWVHVAYTFDGTAWQNTTTPTNVNIYINGTKVDITSIYQIGGGGGTLDLSTAKLGLGASTDFAATNDRQFAHCDLSNFKLYDTMLTAEEVKTLYDMGRCDEGHHVVNFSKTRVGIGLGDGEAPRGALDVRGDIHGGCPVYFAASATDYRYASSSGTVIVFDRVEVSRGGGYDSSTGVFTVPLAGIYRFDFYARQHGSTPLYARIQKNGSSQTFGRAYFGAASVMGGSTGVFRLNVGDTIQIKLYDNSAGRITDQYNGFIGQYISSL